MKKIITIFTLFFSILFVVNAQASELKVGVIDLHKVVSESKEVKEVRQNLETKFKPRQEKLLKMQSAIQENIDKLRRDDAVMTDKQKDELKQKIMQQRSELDKKGASYQEELNTAQNQAMQQFFAKVKKAIEAVANKEKYSLVIQKESAPYVATSLDITDSVLNALK